MKPSHELRHLESLEDYRACVALQDETWGAGFSERVPIAILKVAQSLGGVSAGAFDAGGRLDGFVFGMTGLDAEGGLVHWSDMLAVRPEVGGAGLATRLKAFQRETVLARGVSRMVWTFDPLRAQNAHLNLTKLGASVRTYRRDMYGDTDSVLHRGIGTDRFVATWALDSARVAERLAGALNGSRRSGSGVSPASDTDRPEASALTAVVGAGPPRPGSPRLDLDDPCVGVDIPSDIGEVMVRDPEAAAAWRAATRAVFEHYFSRGYEARELVRAGARATYVLGPTTSESSSTGARG